MPATMNVNFMSVVHKKSTGIAASFPDVCKTPTPGGPVPIPYPNIAMSSNAAKTTKKVKVDKEGVMVKGSNFSMSTGDEAGNAGGGVVSSKFKGKAEFMNYSFDVKFEGKAVARLADPMGNNMGSPMNVPCPAEGQSPLVVTDAQKAKQKEACERLEKKRVPEEDRAQAAHDHGMLATHAEDISGACQESGMSATLRQGNPDCLDRITEGFPTKPCGGAGDSISDVANLPEECRGLVGDVDKVTGQISGIHGTGGLIPAGEINAARGSMGGSEFKDWMKSRGAQTGDYDLHDIFDSGGRVRDGTPAETSFRNGVNDAIGRTDPDTRMVQHGPQSNFAENLEKNPGKRKELLDKFGEEKMDRVLKPDVCRKPPKPLLHFDSNGEMYKIETEDELKDLYACKGADYPSHW